MVLMTKDCPHLSEEVKFNVDKTVWKRPKCAVEGCENEGWIMVGGRLICGECAAKWNKAQTKMIFEQVKEANKK